MYQRAFGVTLTWTRIDGVFATRLIVIAVDLLRLGLYRLRRPADGSPLRRLAADSYLCCLSEAPVLGILFGRLLASGIRPVLKPFLHPWRLRHDYSRHLAQVNFVSPAIQVLHRVYS
jgi:hypothetical protein